MPLTTSVPRSAVVASFAQAQREAQVREVWAATNWVRINAPGEYKKSLRELIDMETYWRENHDTKRVHGVGQQGSAG